MIIRLMEFADIHELKRFHLIASVNSQFEGRSVNKADTTTSAVFSEERVQVYNQQASSLLWF